MGSSYPEQLQKFLNSLCSFVSCLHVLLEGHVGVGEGIVDGQTEESSHLPHELQDEEVTEEIHPSTLVTRA